MKIKLLVIVFFLFNCGLHAQSFIKTQGGATDVAISPKDGSVYVVGTSKNVFKYDTNSKSFKAFGKQSKNIKSITVHPNGTVYMVSTSNEVHIDINGRWNKIPGIKTNEVDIDKNGNIRALDLSGKLKKLFQGRWQDQTLVNRNTSGFNQIIGKDSKVLYGRFKDNAFKEFKNGKWFTLNGSPLQIAMDDKKGEVYAVGRNKGIYKWNKGTNKWILLKNTRKDFKTVAAHNGKIWATTTDNSIYYYGVAGQSSNSNSTTNYAGTYRVTFTRVLTRTVEQQLIKKSIDLFGSYGVYLESKINSGNIKIQPLNGMSNRVWDISKSKPVNVNSKYWKNLRSVQYYRANNGSTLFNGKYAGEFEIDKIREFKVLGEAANKDLVFDIQSNIFQKTLTYDVKFGWQRLKIDVDKIQFGKEIFFQVKAPSPAVNEFYIGLKIEKF